MTDVPAARFQDTATDQGRRELLRSVAAFVQAHGVDAEDRGQIADTLAVILRMASGHASSRCDVDIAVVADVTADDFQLELRLRPGTPVRQSDAGERVGGLELWISFPRGRALVSNPQALHPGDAE
jgi:hypothetical protein